MRHHPIPIALTLAALLLAILSAPAHATLLDPNNGSFTTVPPSQALVESSGTFTFDTSHAVNPLLTGPGLGAGVQGVYSGGVAVFDFTSIAITGSATFNVTGADPLALLSKSTFVMSGTSSINLSGADASGGTGGVNDNGSGSSTTLGNGGGGNGGNGGSSGDQGAGAPASGAGQVGGSNPGGGGGGAFGGPGGNGDAGSGGAGGTAYGNLATALTGGSGGGGGRVNGSGGGGGAGGGVIEIGAITSISITGTAKVLATGGDGAVLDDPNSGDRAGGGGSGGGIFLHAGTVSSGNISSPGSVTLGTGALSVMGGVGADNDNDNGGGGGGGGGRILVLGSGVIAPSSYNILGGQGTDGGRNGGNGVFTNAVPEPSSLVLVSLMGGVFLAIARPWRRKPEPV